MKANINPEGGNWGSSIFFIANLLNFVLATAVFTIPFPMHEVCIILGTIILAITCFISVIACTFIIEALALKNSLLKREQTILSKAAKGNEQEIQNINKNSQNKDKDNDEERPTFLSKETLISNLEVDAKKEEEKEKDNENKKQELFNDIITNDEGEMKERILSIENEEEEDVLDEKNDNFYIKKRFEISKLSKILPKAGYFFVVITIICYLYVGVTSNSIIAGNNLKDIIGKTFGIKEMPGYSYYLVVGCFLLLQ